MTKYYTGVGSRLAPSSVLSNMIGLGIYFANKGYILRSGGADGCDSAFEDGCVSVVGEKEIYIPWHGFNDRLNQFTYNDISLPDIDPGLRYKADEIVMEVHPRYGMLGFGGRALHARNVFQVLGKDLKSPSDFVVCWTPGGELRGGTATAIRIANKFNIEVFNLARPLERLMLDNAIELDREKE